MVSFRCKVVVKSILEKFSIPYKAVELGQVDLLEYISEEQRNQLNMEFQHLGFELMSDKKNLLIEKMKHAVIELVHNGHHEGIRQNFSLHLSQKLLHNYNYLSNLFSAVEGITLEQYIIAHKIERAKELIVYDELSLSEIAVKLHYSSVAHLSAQFKKVTGLTPSEFKKLQYNSRRGLEDVK